MLIEKLPDAFAYHRSIYDQLGEPADYVFLEVNSAFETMTGLKRKDIIDRKVSEVLPDIVKSDFDWIDTYGQLAAEGGTIHFENYSEPLQRYYDVIAYSDIKHHFVTVFRDITDHKQREMELINNQKRFSQAQLFAGMGTWEYHLAEEKLYWSDECAELFGIKPGEFKGSFEAFLAFVHPKDRDYVMQINQPATELSDGIVLNYEHRIVRKDGTVRWVLEEAGPVIDEDGKITKMIGMVKDITAQKNAEAELKATKVNLEHLVEERTAVLEDVNQELELAMEAQQKYIAEIEEKNRALEQAEENLKQQTERLQAILDNSPSLIREFDLNGRYILANQAVASLLGQEASSVIGLCFKDYLPPETAEVVIARFNGVKDSLQPLTFDDSFIFNDRELFYLTTLFPIFNSCGKIRSVGAISHDVTAIKEAEHKLGSTLELYRKGLEGMIKSMGTLMSQRDNYTAGHQLRVARLAVAIAEGLGLDEHRIEGIKLAAEVHDIGKIGIPAEILTKPGELEDLQYSIIQTHPRSGYEILKNIEFPWPLAEIIAQHHEKVDGSGYPEGLRGDQILLEAKIICLADVVEAMASHRPYRAARGIDAALEEIERQRGILFDEDVVDACLRLFREKGFQLEQLKCLF